ncbi:MAG: CAP domain-containing protein [Erysipelotrichales bacterium]|nr:CAP domain-containing protein [Erysipelotrichales bacterium]
MKRFLLLFFTALLLISCSKEIQTNEAIPLAEAELFNSQRLLKASITTRGELDEEAISSLISSAEIEVPVITTTVTTTTTAVTTKKPNTTTKITTSTTSKPVTTTSKVTTTPKVTTTTKPTTTSTVVQTTTNSDFVYSSEALEILKLDNEKRSAVGKSALVLDEALTKAANARAKELVTKFSHTRPDGTNYSTILSSYGVTSKVHSEIIAWGYNSPKEAVEGWMNSSVHKANILDTNNRGFTKVGIGYYNNNGKKYWVQIFAK